MEEVHLIVSEELTMDLPQQMFAQPITGADALEWFVAFVFFGYLVLNGALFYKRIRHPRQAVVKIDSKSSDK